MKILITGGAGFVGHHFVEHFLKNTKAEIVVLDKLNYASSGLRRLKDIDAYRDQENRVTVLSADFTLPFPEGCKEELEDVTHIFHIGAESHVDNSIIDPEPFVRSNVLGTMHVLDFARELHQEGSLECFYYFSTDEVFGPAPAGVSYKEDDAHNPTNPYAATKSGGEMLVKAYRNTYQLPAIITRSMNIFGERQHPEKFIPKVINKVLAGDTVYIHANADKTKAGSRFYIHARNVADGYLHLLDHGVVGEDYHITGEEEVDNLTLAQMIAEIMGKPLKYDMVDFHSSRPGHDLRYALDGSKIAESGWELPRAFKQSLEKTVRWMLEHPEWLEYEYPPEGV